jgi:hypothetical protein
MRCVFSCLSTNENTARVCQTLSTAQLAGKALLSYDFYFIFIFKRKQNFLNHDIHWISSVILCKFIYTRTYFYESSSSYDFCSASQYKRERYVLISRKIFRKKKLFCTWPNSTFFMLSSFHVISYIFQMPLFIIPTEKWTLIILLSQCHW